MPLQRESKAFKDISMSFQRNPLNSDLIAISNESAISRSVRNLVSTIPGECFFNPNLGTKIYKSLFENMDELTASALESEITLTIKNYEPRVDLKSVKVTPIYDANEYDIVINYTIIGVDVLPQQLSFALQPTR
jgi:phage baseplate assembly protein W